MSSLTIKQFPSRVDVAVIGGGPAGSSTAIALARAGLRVAVIERQATRRRRVGETLPPSCRLLLDKLELWSEFEAAGHVRSAGNSSAWGGPELSDRDFLFDPYGPGWHLDRQRFDEMMLGAAASAGAVTLAGVKLSRCEAVTGAGWRVELYDGTTRALMGARVVVDASGRSSAFARYAGAARRFFDRMVGVVGYLSAGAHKERLVAMIEAAEGGWWYSAPLPCGRLVIAYMTDADLAAAQMLRDPESWMALLRETTHTRDRVEPYGYRMESNPRLVPASSSCLSSVAGSSWLAVGDTAATFDPLSSQGIVTAISTGLDAASSIQSNLQGDASALRQYAERMKNSYASYLANRAAYYRMERRWAGAPFWRRRATAATRPQEQGR